MNVVSLRSHAEEVPGMAPLDSKHPDPEIASLTNAERQALETRLVAALTERIRKEEAERGIRYLVAFGRVEDRDPETKKLLGVYTVRVGVHENKIRQIKRERMREEGIASRQWVRLRKRIKRRQKAKDVGIAA